MFTLIAKEITGNAFFSNKPILYGLLLIVLPSEKHFSGGVVENTGLWKILRSAVTLFNSLKRVSGKVVIMCHSGMTSD